jgi:thiol-disulfide isomerase/thioredoxin
MDINDLNRTFTLTQSFNLNPNNKCDLNIFDSFDGDLSQVHLSMNSNEYTFVYFYASWCAKSIYFKKLIQQLSCVYSKKVNSLLLKDGKVHLSQILLFDEREKF